MIQANALNSGMLVSAFDNIRALTDAFCNHHSVARATVSSWVLHDTYVLDDIANGSCGLGLERYERLLVWYDLYWPDGLAWPDVPRPHPDLAGRLRPIQTWRKPGVSRGLPGPMKFGFTPSARRSGQLKKHAGKKAKAEAAAAEVLKRQTMVAAKPAHTDRRKRQLAPA